MALATVAGEFSELALLIVIETTLVAVLECGLEAGGWCPEGRMANALVEVAVLDKEAFLPIDEIGPDQAQGA